MMVKNIIILILLVVSYQFNQTDLLHKVNMAQKSWKAGINQYFEGMNIEQIKHMMGTLETPEHLKLPLR